MPTHKPSLKDNPKANLFKVSLKLPNNFYQTSAATIRGALDKIETPVYFKGKGIIEARLGKLKSEVWMYPVQLRKLFVNPTSKMLLAKRLILTLK
jgi:hypothetical protein